MRVRSEHAPLPVLVTTLFVELGDGSGERTVTGVREIALGNGGLDVRTHRIGDGSVLSVDFDGVCQGVRAAMEVLLEHGSEGVRVAVDTTGADGPDGGPPGHAGRADRLLASAPPGRIRASATTVLVSGPALPPGVEFVDAGIRTPDDRRGRVYDLVDTLGPATDPHGGPDRPAGRCSAGGSTLDWARRAAHGTEPPAGDYQDVVAEAWSRTAAGQGETWLLSGGTATTQHAAAAAIALSLHARGALVLHGRWAAGTVRPYRAFREALGAHAGAGTTARLTADLQGQVEVCARLVPELRARIPATAPERTAPPSRAPIPTLTEAFDAVELWLQAVAGRGPAVLVLTDAQWAEPASVRLLARLPGVARRLRLLVLVCGPEDADRSEDSWAWFAAATGSSVQRVELPSP